MSHVYQPLKDAVLALADDDLDRATERNGKGFSRADSGVGNAAAFFPTTAWTDDFARDVKTMLAKYRRQLSNHAIVYDDLPAPPPEPQGRLIAIDEGGDGFLLMCPRTPDLRKIVRTTMPGWKEIKTPIRHWVVTPPPGGALSLLETARRADFVMGPGVADRARTLDARQVSAARARAQQDADGIGGDIAVASVPPPVYERRVCLETGDLDAFHIYIDKSDPLLDEVRNNLHPWRRFSGYDVPHPHWRLPAKKATALALRRFVDRHDIPLDMAAAATLADLLLAVGKVEILEDGRYAVSFAYDEELLSSIKTVPGARFTSEPAKHWVVPLERNALRALRTLLIDHPEIACPADVHVAIEEHLVSDMIDLSLSDVRLLRTALATLLAAGTVGAPGRATILDHRLSLVEALLTSTVFN